MTLSISDNYTECRNAKCRVLFIIAECHCAEFHYAECHMLSVIMLNVVMLSVNY